MLITVCGIFVDRSLFRSLTPPRPPSSFRPPSRGPGCIRIHHFVRTNPSSRENQIPFPPFIHQPRNVLQAPRYAISFSRPLLRHARKHSQFRKNSIIKLQLGLEGPKALEKPSFFGGIVLVCVPYGVPQKQKITTDSFVKCGESECCSTVGRNL